MTRHGSEMLDQIFSRVCQIIAGYFAGTLVFALIFAGSATYVFSDGSREVGGLLRLTIIFFSIFSYFLALPIAFAVAVTEMLGLRCFLYYVSTWALVGLVKIQSNRPLFPSLDGPTPLALSMTLAAGAGGLAYWAVAGRSTKPRSPPTKRSSDQDGRAKPTTVYRRP
jgi:hypothetical protein